MLKIRNHPIWNNIHPLKKEAHLLRLFLAKQYGRRMDPRKYVGVIGSVGKTTTMVACKAVLSESMNVVSSTDTHSKTPNLDPIFNIPMTLMRAKAKDKKVLFEFGIEYPGEMDFYFDMVKPKTVIVTRLSHEHNQFLGSLDDVIKEETKSLDKLPKDAIVILNWDDPNCRKVAEKIKAEKIFYGTDPQKCHVWASSIKISDFKTYFQLNYGVERVEVRSNLLGQHMVYPLLAAAALGISVDMPLFTIRKGLEKVYPADHRLQVVDGINGSTILDDTYNAQPAAVEEALDTLNYVQARKRIVVLGEMKELGQYTEELHREIARKIFKDKADIVILGKGDTKYIADELKKLGFKSNRLFCDFTNPQMVDQLTKVLSKGDVALIKGANSLKLYEVVRKVTRTKKT